MADINPNLIPLPSIGESKTSQQVPVQVAKTGKSKLWIVVLLCVMVGIGLGVFVYQQSIAPAPKPSVKPTVTPKAAQSPAINPQASPETPEINVVTPQSNEITFPKAGEVRIYVSGFGSPTMPGSIISVSTATEQSELTLPGTVPAGDKMTTINSDLTVAAGDKVTIEVYDGGDEERPGYGWIAPDAAGKCGGDAATKADASQLIAWATAKSGAEPLVSIQCWADWGAPNDASLGDFNDYFIIMSYVPSSQQGSPTPSVSPVASPSLRPSPSPSPSPAASPSVRPSPSPSPIASIVGGSPSPSPYVPPTVAASPRITMPEGSALPDAGIFEVTAGTIGLGLVFLILGAIGLLMI